MLMSMEEQQDERDWFERYMFKPWVILLALEVQYQLLKWIFGS